jgi:hypothetical protein
MLDTLQAPTDEPLDLSAALGDVLHQARTDPGETQVGGAGKLEVLVLTDLQARAFRPEDPDAEAAALKSTALKSTEPKSASTAPKPDADAAKSASAARTAAGAKGPAGKSARAALFEVLDELQAMNVRVVVESLAGADPMPANLGIASVEPLERFHGPGQVSEMGVEVANFGANPKNSVRVVLEVDGERKPNQSVDVPARGRAQVVFPIVFKASGEHVVTARLEEGDHLAVDNQRSRVVIVPPAVRVLLVDGAPGAVIEEDETGFLRAVIDPRRDDVSLSIAAPFEPREIPPDELSTGDVDLSAFDVIWLANVESLPAPVVDKLEAAVAAGRALIVSLGDRVDAAAANARLFRADGTGLLPASIEEHVAVRSRAEAYYRVKSFDATHPALSFFADERFKPLLTEVPVYEFAAVRPIAGARVLATLDDDGSHPLLVERAYDRGKVFLWTTTIDPAWTRLPESPATLVPLVHELLRYAASQPEPPRNVTPGTPLSAETEQFPRNVVLVRPDGARRALDGEAANLPGGRWKLPAVQSKDTEAAGVYRIEMDGGKPISFAVGVDPLEGDLERISAADLHALHPAFVASDDVADDGTSEPQRHGELWRPIAIACLVILVLETMWAAWLGVKRSVRA